MTGFVPSRNEPADARQELSCGERALHRCCFAGLYLSLSRLQGSVLCQSWLFNSVMLLVSIVDE